MNRVTQFVSFTSIMSVSMVCLAVMLLLLARGTSYPVAVQVTLPLQNQIVAQAGLIASLMVTTIAYGMGVGAVPYTMVGELFTPEHRTLGSCLAQVVRWVNGGNPSMLHFSPQERHCVCPGEGNSPRNSALGTALHLLLPWRRLCTCGCLCMDLCPGDPGENALAALLHIPG